MFNKQFKGRNKSAIIAELMQDAIEADRLAERRTRLMNDLMERRSLRPRVSADDAESARAALLPGVAAGSESVVQPVHWLAEVAGVLARLSPATAEEDAVLLHALEWPVADAMDVWSRAVRMSIDLDHHLFDTLYHATALEAGGVLVTADRRYARKAKHIGHIRLVG